MQQIYILTYDNDKLYLYKMTYYKSFAKNKQ